MAHTDRGACPSCDAILKGDRIVWMRDPLETPRTNEVLVACSKCLALSTSYSTRDKPILQVSSSEVMRTLEIFRRAADEGRLLSTLETMREDPALRSPEVYAAVKPALRGRIELARSSTMRVWRDRVRRITLYPWNEVPAPPHRGQPYRLGGDATSIRFFLPKGTELNITGHKLAWAILAPLKLPFTREESRAKRSTQAIEAEACLLRPDAEK